MNLTSTCIRLSLAVLVSACSTGFAAAPLTLELGGRSPQFVPGPGGAAFSPDGAFVLVGMSEGLEGEQLSKIVVYRTADGRVVRDVPWPVWPRNPRTTRQASTGDYRARDWSYLQSGELLTRAADGWGYLLWDVASIIDPACEPRHRWLLERDAYVPPIDRNGEPQRQSLTVVAQGDANTVVIKEVWESGERRKPTRRTVLLTRFNLDKRQEVGQKLELKDDVWQFAAEAQGGVLEAISGTSTLDARLWRIRWDDYQGEVAEYGPVVPGGYGPRLGHAICGIMGPRSYELSLHKRDSPAHVTSLRLYPRPTKGHNPVGAGGVWTPDERYVVLGDNRSLLKVNERSLVIDLIDTQQQRIAVRQNAGTATSVMPLAVHAQTLHVGTVSNRRTEPTLQIWIFGTTP
jgi:hypothetical protein